MRDIWILAAAALLCGCNRQGLEQAKSAPQSGARTAAPAPANGGKDERHAAEAKDGRPVLVCFGDSLTEGHGLEPDQSYPSVLQGALDRRGGRFRVVNYGVSGDTTQDGLARLPLVVAEKPRIVVLEFGANDGLRGLPLTGTRQNLEQMIVALQGAEARIVLAGITLPPNYGPDYIRRFEAIYKDLAAKYKLPLIPFLLEGVAGNARLMQSDGLHPTAEGTRIVAQTVMRALDPLLARP
jgi:acyl-CoA thioesterase I